MTNEGERVTIPLRSGDEAVFVTSSHLLDNVNELIDLLRSEQVKLDIWLQLAVTYYQQQKFDQFLQILKTAATQNYGDNADKIAILDSLAAYYIELAKNTVNKEQKHKYQEEASNYFNKADRIQVIRDEVGKAVLLLQKGDAKRAYFSFGNNIQPSLNVPALLGRASILYHHGSFKEALELYKKVLEINPNCPPCVRNGIALCFYKIGRVNLARKWFERVLEMEEGNIVAILSCAIIEMNSDTIGCIKRSYQVIGKLYKTNPNHSRILNLLSNYYFHRNDFNKSEALAMRAIKNSDVAKIRAESYYLLAKKYHTQNQYEEAFDYYQKSVELWADYPLALFGLAQLFIFKNRLLNAQNILEKLIELCPNNVETLKLLSSLYLLLNQNAEISKEYLRKVVEKRPNDFAALIELAQLCERSDLKTSLSSYEKAALVLENRINNNNNDNHNHNDNNNNKQKRPIEDFKDGKMGLELWNNIGVLRYRLGDIKGSEIAYLKSIECSGSDLMNFHPLNVTTSYNLARLYEEQNRLKEAEVLYIGILKEHPSYLDCYYRLANIAKSIGHYADAIGWIQFSNSIDQRNITSWTMLGEIYLQQKSSQKAQFQFEQILKKFEKNDVYSLLSLGNIFFLAKFHKKEKAERYLNLAEKYYWKVLNLQANNYVAVNGLAMVFAERKLIEVAKDCLMKVKESAPNFPDVWVNLAHIFIKQKHYSSAISLYSKALTKFYYGKDDHLLLYLSFAYYLNRDYHLAKRTITKAIHLSPTNLNLWYNLVIILRVNAKMILISAASKSSSKVPVYDIVSINELEEGLNDLKRGKDLLSSLLSRIKNTKIKRNFTTRDCDKLMNKLDHLQKKSTAIWDAVQKKREFLLEKERKMKMDLDIKMREENEDQKNKKKLQMQREKEIAANIAQANADLLSQMQQTWSSNEDRQSRRKKSSRPSADDSSGDESDNNNDNNDDNDNGENNNDDNNDRNNSNNNNNEIDEYGSNTVDLSLLRKNASHLDALVADTRKKSSSRDSSAQENEEQVEEEEEDQELGFDEELIRECMKDPENKSWLALKKSLISKGVDSVLVSSKRKLVLDYARKFKKQKQ